MAGEWQPVPLSELTDSETPITYGVVKPGPEDPDGVLFIRGGDIANGRVVTERLRTITRDVSDQYRRTQLRGGEIVVSLVGNPGQVAIVPDSLNGANIARQVGLVRLRADVDARFVKYFLGSHTGQEALGAHSLGSVQQVINLRDLKTVVVSRPPLSEQRAIAHILGTLDDKIDLNRRMGETLEAMARALFKSWFVDFDPVLAKMEGRWQRGQSLPGLPARLYDLFPDRLVDSELGEIPEGWEVGQFGDVVTQRKEAVNPSESPETRFAHFSLPAFDEGRTPKMELGEAIKSNKWKVSPASVLLSKLNPEIDRTWLVDVGEGDNAICSTEFLVLVPREPFSRTYVYCLARSQSFRQHIESLVTGTSKSHQRAQADAVFGLETVLPSKSIVEAFSQVAEGALARTLVMKRDSRALAALRDTLLPKLISGELRVREASRLVKEVA